MMFDIKERCCCVARHTFIACHTVVHVTLSFTHSTRSSAFSLPACLADGAALLKAVFFCKSVTERKYQNLKLDLQNVHHTSHTPQLCGNHPAPQPPANSPCLLLLQEWLDALVLCVEVGHVHDKVLHHKHVGEGGDLADVCWVAVDLAQAGKAVLAVQVHSTGATDALPAEMREESSTRVANEE